MSQKAITSFFKPKCSDGHAENMGTGKAEKRVSAVISNTSKKCKTENGIPQEEINIASTLVKKVEDINPKSDETLSNSNKKLLQSNCKNEEILNSPKQLTQITFGKEMTTCTKGEDYNPAISKYNPVNDAFWNGMNTPYLALARTFQLIEETKGRLKMIEILSNFYSSVIKLNPEDLLPSVYMTINQLAPAYEGIEIGVAETSLMKIICNATGRDMKHIKLQVQEIGDLGLVAEQSRFAQRRITQPLPLTLRGVFEKMKQISKLTGSAKINVIQDVFVACRLSEARYFIRSLIGKLRIGIAEQSLFYALALGILKADDAKEKAFCCTNVLQDAVLKKQIDNTASILRDAYCRCPNYDIVISSLLKFGIDNILEHCRVTPGIPMKPMLAQPTKSISEILQRFERLHITCEWKYDGERAQIHCNDNGVVSIFSRNQENNTLKYPDITSRIKEFMKPTVKSFIIDSEIVAWDEEQKKILPFQILTTRKRKNVNLEDIKVNVCVYAFDLLYLNSEALISEPFSKRRGLMKQHFETIEGHWHFATSTDTQDIDEIQQLLEESVKGNCEGLMIKTLDVEATYEIAKRSRNWLKLKKDYISGIGDSLDLVIIGAWLGKGKRTGIYGGFLLACYDDENEEYQSICKIGTGFTDEDLGDHTKFLKTHIINSSKSYYRYDNSLEPDVWFDAAQVWEIKCADLSLSPVHRAAIGMIDADRGISLRFPRFIRIRDDKAPEDATTAKQVASMYSSQDQIKNNQIASSQLDEDFFL